MNALSPLPALDLSEVVTKIDKKILRNWLKDLEKVLPVVIGRDGVVFTKNERPLFQFLMNSRAGGLTPHEAYAFVGILHNLPQIIDAAQSQQADFVVVRRALAGTLQHLPQKDQVGVERILRATEYIEGP